MTAKNIVHDGGVQHLLDDGGGLVLYGVLLVGLEEVAV